MPRPRFFLGRLPARLLALGLTASCLAALCLTPPGLAAEAIAQGDGGDVAPAPAAADAPAPAATPQACREGSWVSYRVVAAPERLYFVTLPDNDPGTPPPQEFACTFTVRRHEAGKTLLALRLAQTGLPPLEELLLDSFPLERLTAPDAASHNLEVTSGQPAEFVIPAAADRPAETIAATKVTLNGAGQKLEVWKSPAVPFGILRVSCEGFQLSLTGYGW